MATCKIMRRNFAMKIGSSKEVYSAKDKKMSLGGEKVSFISKQQAMFAKNTKKKTPDPARNALNKKKDNPQCNWNDPAYSEVTLKREENKGPLRAIRSAFYNRPAIIPAASSGKLTTKDSFTNTIKRVFGPYNEESTDEEMLSQRGAVATLAANRRLLKSSNAFKIFPSRRFGSSASSSCCSLFRRHDDRRRASSFKRTFRGGFVERAYNTQPNTNSTGSHSIANISSTKYLESVRNQNMSTPLGSVSHAVQLSSQIQEDLMPIDKTLLERISLKNSHISKVHFESKDSNPMCGWHHPPSPDTLSTRTLPRRPVSCLTEKVQDISRTRTIGTRKKRLDMQCKPIPDTPCPTTSSNASTVGLSAAASVKKVPVSQQLSPLSSCDTGVTSETVSSRHMSQLTARRLTNVDQQPIRRFSLRRPPKTSVTEVTIPAPGPAAENLLNQNKISSTSSPRTFGTLTFNPSPSRFSRLNSRVY